MASFLASLWSEFMTIWHIVFHRISGTSHKERLESFYASQARHYDSFRRRLLHGREQMLDALPQVEQPISNAVVSPRGTRSKSAAAASVWVDMGGGTGQNVAHVAQKLGSLARFSKIYIVDLSPSLLAVARERAQAAGWDNVECIEADATLWVPAEGPASVDLVTFSYSLTMIPDWFAAVEHAQALLRPKGTLGVVDFYVARKWPAPGMQKHSFIFRTFWQLWFHQDNVFLSHDALPFLQRHFEATRLEERLGPFPYITFIKTPHYIFIGKKRG